MEFEMVCNSICVSLAGIVDSTVCLITQFFLFQKQSQDKPVDRDIIPNAETKVPMVKSIFTFIEGQ